MPLAKGLREVRGQLVYDRPWHCALCRRNYRGERRVLVEFWDFVIGWKRETLRLCVWNEKTQTPGCSEMGFQRLFIRSRNMVRRLRDRRKVA